MFLPTVLSVCYLSYILFHLNPQFFILLLKLQNSLLIPRWLTKIYGQELQHHALLEDPAGNVLVMKTHRHRNRYWFGKSITILRTIYKLHNTAWIKFSYIQPAKFEIRVYDSNNHEVEYPAKITNNLEETPQHHKGKHADKPGVPVNYDTIRYWNEMVASGKHGLLMWKAILSPEEMKGKSERVFHLLHFIIFFIPNHCIS